MISESALRGYLLEEVLAWLLLRSGYRLLVTPDLDGPEQELRPGKNGLLVHGRGADHQVDALGEFIYSAPFSLPLRLFVEAKFRGTRTGLAEVRNAYGVIRDVNENYVQLSDDKQLRRRYQYAYALFSTSGFSRNAQEYALAHQLSLIDLSGPEFDDLRSAIQDATQAVWRLPQFTNRNFPIARLRWLFRVTLGTQDETDPLAATAVYEQESWLPDGDVSRIARDLRSTLEEYTGGEFLLAFPPAPFVLTLRGRRRSGIQSFLNYVAQYPHHEVGLRRRLGRDRRSSTWDVFPRDNENAYRLSFNLPDRIESWIAREGEERERTMVRLVKKNLLPSLVIYRFVDDVAQLFRLDYAPQRLRE